MVKCIYIFHSFVKLYLSFYIRVLSSYILRYLTDIISRLCEIYTRSIEKITLRVLYFAINLRIRPNIYNV